MDYTFQKFNDDIDRLVYEIKVAGCEYDYIVGIVRGGLIPAVVLSHKLESKADVVPLTWSHDKDKREYNAWIPEEIQNGKKVLLVDDIIDTGRSMREILADWQVEREQVHLACLIFNTAQETVPNFYGRLINRDVDKQWVNFWWEK